MTGAWHREATGYYTRGGWTIFAVDSAYGDRQWVIDAPDAPAFGQADTLREAKLTVDRAVGEVVR